MSAQALCLFAIFLLIALAIDTLPPTTNKHSKKGTVAFWGLSTPAAGLSVLENARFHNLEEQPALVQWAPFGHGVVSVGKLKGSSAHAHGNSGGGGGGGGGQQRQPQQEGAARRAARHDTLYLWNFPLTGKSLRSPEVGFEFGSLER